MKLALLLADKARDEFFSDGMYSSERFGTHVHSTTCVMSSLAQIADLLHDGPLMSLVHVFFNNGLTQISDSLGWSIENSDPSSVPDRGEANNTGDILETSCCSVRMATTTAMDALNRSYAAICFPANFVTFRLSRPPRTRSMKMGKEMSPLAIWAHSGSPLLTATCRWVRRISALTWILSAV